MQQALRTQSVGARYGAAASSRSATATPRLAAVSSPFVARAASLRSGRAPAAVSRSTGAVSVVAAAAAAKAPAKAVSLHKPQSMVVGSPCSQSRSHELFRRISIRSATGCNTFDSSVARSGVSSRMDRSQSRFSYACSLRQVTKEEACVLYEDMYLGRSFEDMCAQARFAEVRKAQADTASRRCCGPRRGSAPVAFGGASWTWPPRAGAGPRHGATCTTARTIPGEEIGRHNIPARVFPDEAGR